MRFSVVIPTHNPKYLQETLDSVYAQTFSDWEIVLCPNNGADISGLALDPRVRIVECPSSENVGEIKKFAFSQGIGEILVETDHDDLLLPECLAELDMAFSDDSVGFAYSDFAEFNQDGSARAPYNPEYGWKHEPFDWNGRTLFRQISWKPSPQSVSLVLYAPNHVRAWRKSVYEEIGGHDPAYKICDDQELLCRTYLATKMFHVEKCLYLYRVHGENTWLKYERDIDGKMWHVYHDYIQRLCLKWSRDNGLAAIDLCGGFDPPEGFTSVDKVGGDVVADLDGPWPFADGSVGVIRAADALEHMKDKLHTMSEIHRVLAPGGMLLGFTPSTDGRGAFQDPTHVAYWNENSFWYYTRAPQARYIRNEAEHFQEQCLVTSFPSDWHRENNICYVTSHLTRLGAERIPGIKRI